MEAKVSPADGILSLIEQVKKHGFGEVTVQIKEGKVWRVAKVETFQLE